MAKKKTSVTLPGGIQNLVRNLQNGQGASLNVEQPRQEEAPEEEQKAAEPQNNGRDYGQGRAEQPAAPAHEQVTETPRQQGEQRETQQNAANNNSGRSGASVLRVATQEEANAQEQNEEQKEGQYNVIVDDSEDSWRMFLDTAEQYKHNNGKLATIYIDEQLKNILDRLKYAGKEKLTTAAILSSIVARFVYDHQGRIEKILFGGKLI